MGIRSFDPFERCGILVCDACEAVLAPGGRTERAWRDMTPDELLPLFDERPDLLTNAHRAGWFVDERAKRALCEPCRKIASRRAATLAPASAPAPVSARGGRFRSGTRLRAGRVLLVDDDVACLGTLSAILLERHLVDVQSDPLAAVARIRSGGSYDLVLCDVTMPGITGPQLHEVVERERPDLARRFVFMTANEASPRELRGQPCLEKPLDGEALHAIVENCVRAPDGALPDLTARERDSRPA